MLSRPIKGGGPRPDAGPVATGRAQGGAAGVAAPPGQAVAVAALGAADRVRARVGRRLDRLFLRPEHRLGRERDVGAHVRMDEYGDDIGVGGDLPRLPRRRQRPRYKLEILARQPFRQILAFVLGGFKKVDRLRGGSNDS